MPTYRIKSNNHSYFLVAYYSTEYMNPINVQLSGNDAKDYVNETAAGNLTSSGVSQICGFCCFVPVCPAWGRLWSGVG